MPAAPAYSPESFTLEYRPDQHLLIGRWLRQANLDELKTHYEALLASALAHGCRHWLLDVRRRRVGDAPAAEWFGQEFMPRLSAAFAQPLYLAYFAMIAHDQATTNPGLNANIQQGSIQQMHYHYFNQEGECLAWLAGRA
ncbi:hypothetical protein E4631_03300 [Hymenobacter sp. UV11]|uniref:hypothetical protein n=1 Tax=Hymenobacter sp. UV11 TaxID=1849735 RepID=UPI001060CBE8|nr:hypothetical protein [Hymenobacter sp. UV11]TDN38369.1 hypothetical protein A8B98_23715 [Hymenobacter sp. UV11]TFZ68032.1 hypothetical protein E4631_03300 [Hymenobacter sp. UV11]